MAETREPDKWVWTEADFDRMGWHDCIVHAVAFQPERYELLLDLDYIFEWISPKSEQTRYHFWIAPATLVFENVHGTRFDVETNGGLQVMSLERASVRRPKNADFIGREEEWEWTFDLLEGQIDLWSVGFRMHVRSLPCFGHHQSLTEAERGGFRFEANRLAAECAGQRMT